VQWRRNEFESGGTPVRSESGGHRSTEKTFFGRAPPLFWLYKQISRFGERFRDSLYSLVSFLIAVLSLTVSPRAQPFVKWGTRAPVPHGVGATDFFVWICM